MPCVWLPLRNLRFLKNHLLAFSLISVYMQCVNVSSRKKQTENSTNYTNTAIIICAVFVQHAND